MKIESDPTIATDMAADRAGPGFAAKMFDVILRMRAVVALVLLVVLFSVSTSTFLTANNLTILAKHVAITAILAIGMTFVVLTGGIDLSVGSVAGLAGMVAGALLTRGLVFSGMQHPLYPGILTVVFVSLVVGALVGLLNGLLVVRFAVAPFIATLGTLYIARGAALLISHGATFPSLGGEAARHNTGFLLLGQATLFSVPLPVWIMIALAIVASVLASKTPFGRHVYAVGGNERAALLSGIRVGRVKLISYVISTVCAATVGLIIASQLEAAHPATGESFELNAIAAVVLGGTSLMGGRGSVLGSLAGAFVIGVLADGMVMLGISEFWQMVIKGVVIVLAVAVDQLQTKLQLRLARSH
ncbi:MAG: ABC transporter permease [Candidatus Acidiferrales bacterium]